MMDAWKDVLNDIRFTHIASLHLFTFFVIWKCVFCWNMSYTGGVCYLWVLEASFREVGVQ